MSLLTTKLTIPPPRSSLVRRARLVERLDEGLRLGRRLTLISAPAGFGKTTLLGDWASNCGRPVAWVSLEEGDGDPVRFWEYVVAALRTLRLFVDAGAELGKALLTELHSSQRASGGGVVSSASGVYGEAMWMEAMLTGLVNEIAALPHDPSAGSGPDLLLVLDDYHVIEAQPIHAALSFLLDHLPPQMHLVIAGRAYPPFPLARLRARGQLTELRADDLRFTPDEAMAFLNQTMQLGLTAEDVAALDARTEGWIAGLQLAAVAIQSQASAPAMRFQQRQEDVHSFIATFAGEDRHILDYLTEEVLHQQPEAVRAFLLETSILVHLSGPLCDAVTESDSSQEMLERLERANLFVSPLDNRRQWYRYHHLFADLLRHRLRQDVGAPGMAPLHRRAAAWYERNGFLDEAINHALAGQDLERAARLVEQNYESAFRRNEITLFLDWFDAFPQEFIRSRPSLCVAHAWALIANIEFDAAEARAQDAMAALGIRDDGGSFENLGADARRMLGHIDAIRATALGHLGNYPRAISLAHRALENLPEDDVFQRGVIAFSLGEAYIARMDLVAAIQALSEAVAASQRTGNTMITLAAMIRLGLVYALQDDLYQAVDMYRQAIRVGREMGGSNGQPHPATGLALVYLAYTLYQWNDLDDALAQAMEGITHCKRWGDFGLVVDGYLVLARVQQARGDAVGVRDALAEARRPIDDATAKARRMGMQARTDDIAWETHRVEATQAHLWLIQGDVGAAARWVTRQVREGKLGDDDIHIYLVRPRLLIAQGKPEEALRLLALLLPRAKTTVSVGMCIDVLAVRACAYQALGDTEQALATLARALSLAEPGGYVRIFVDKGPLMAELLSAFSHWPSLTGSLRTYVNRLLAAFDREHPDPTVSRALDLKPETLKPETPLVEPLSERELDVLRLIAANLTNQEIADALFVSVNTVKTHIKRLYAKLNVHNRIEAIERSAELGLLPR